MAGRRGGDTGGVAGGGASGWGDRAGVDGERGGRMFLRRVAASGADGLLAALLSMVVGAELQARGGDRRSSAKTSWSSCRSTS